MSRPNRQPVQKSKPSATNKNGKSYRSLTTMQMPWVDWFRDEAKRRNVTMPVVIQDAARAYKKLCRDAATLPETARRQINVNF